MNARATKKLVAGGALGAMLIGTVALASAASADQVGDDQGVDVSVEIESNVEPGNLALSVASNATSLTEQDSTVEGTREFTGTLPDVTVTDTRTVDQIAEGSYWYVLGSASPFTGDAGQAAIGAENLGWAPALLSESESQLVTEGEGVDPILEADGDRDPIGLVDQDLLVSAFDSGLVNPEGSWTANAGLTLRTAEDVAAGAYSSTITLSLFEDIEP